MARLAGIVHGVVVQMTTLRGFSLGNPRALPSSAGTANLTQIEGEMWSLYSISASASAVSKGMLQ